MVTDSAALVMFAIQSAIKLGQQMRQAYVDATKRRELLLPLPNFFSSPDIASAANYFAGDGNAHMAKTAHLAELLARRKTPAGLTPNEEAEVLYYHTEFFNLDRAQKGKLGYASDGTTLNANEFNALITIRQWQRGDDPSPSTIQRVAGTLIEIGIDYFTNVPGALNKDSRQGKIIAGFLQGMSEIHFSEELLGEIPGRLFVAALDTLTENANLLSADPKIQELVKVSTKSLSTNAANYIDQLRKSGSSDLVKEERVADWAELIFRSLLTSAGGLVLSNPEKFLGIKNEGKAALVSQVGESILGVVVNGSELHLDRLLSRDGLEKIIKSALTVVGEHPEILQLGKNAGLQGLISSVASELSKYGNILTPDILPELIRLILEKTGENLDLLWPSSEKNPQQHLLLTAASTTLEILTRKPTDDQEWKPRFTQDDVLAVLSKVFDELVKNPTWLLEKAGKLNENLKIVLGETLDVLRRHANERLSTATAVEILKAVLVKVSTRKDFLDKIPGFKPEETRTIITAILDDIFSALFDKNLDLTVGWQLVRSETMGSLVNIALTEFSKIPLSQEKVLKFDNFLKQQIESLAAGEVFDLSAFETKLQEMLTAA